MEWQWNGMETRLAAFVVERAGRSGPWQEGVSETGRKGPRNNKQTDKEPFHTIQCTKTLGYF